MEDDPYLQQTSAAINIPTRGSRSASPFPTSFRSTTSLSPPTGSLYNSPTKQSRPENTDNSSLSKNTPLKDNLSFPENTFPEKDNSSLPETKRNESTIHIKAVIDTPAAVAATGSMSISPSSRDVVLATRKGLFIIDLENPFETPRELHHLTKWEVADVQWNPHRNYETLVASTSNQKGLIWNLASSSPIETILHAHNRAISDINWHPLTPNELATCSIDTYIHVWDIKTPKKPARSFCAWSAGATQVKFNKKNQFLLASAHDKELYIWDTRKGSHPITKIRAHESKIHGIDWSRTSADNIITCSLDKSVKFWNIQEPDNCKSMMCTSSPIWRARHTPVGDGILTMPQRLEYKLYLWSKENLQSPVHTFEVQGHTDVLKEFVWRVKGDGDPTIDNREFQLVTWSKDRKLRLWPVNDTILKAIGHERGKKTTDQTDQTGQSASTFRNPPTNKRPTPSMLTIPRIYAENLPNINANLRPTGASVVGGKIKGYMGAASGMFRAERRFLSPLQWIQGVKMIKTSEEIVNVGEISSMGEEFAAVSKKYPNVKFEKANIQSRSCTISLHGPWSDSGVAHMRINITFPQQYPEKVPPNFEIQRTGMISVFSRAYILQDLKNISYSHVAQKRPCLEACVRYLLGDNPQEVGQERHERVDSDFESYISTASYDKTFYTEKTEKDDTVIPFPRLCGAKFCATGKLVCFFSDTSYAHHHPRSYDNWEQFRVLSRLLRPAEYEDDPLYEENLAPFLKSELPNDSTLFLRTELEESDKTEYAIHIFDFSEWMPISQKLAKEYTLRGDDPVKICEHNAKVAADNNRSDLKQIWLLASLILSQTVSMKLLIDEVIPTEQPSGPRQMLIRRESGDTHDSFIHEFFGELNWGFHPYGRSLAKDLINHFASIGDIQTAAMLSCVFKQPFPPYRMHAEVKEIQPLKRPEIVTGSISSNLTDYFNYHTRHPEKLNQYQYQSSLSGTSFGFTGGALVGSFNSSKSSWEDYPSYSLSYVNGTTPPTPSGYPYGQPEGAVMVPVSSSYHHQRRSTSGSTSKESNSYSLSLSLGTTVSSSRTSRRGSPTTNRLDGLANGKSLETLRPDKKTDLAFNKRRNWDKLDDEMRPVRVSLLDDKIETHISHDQFRLAYAELLYHWGLYEERAELLKFMKFVKTTVGSPLGERQPPLDVEIHCFECDKVLKEGRKCSHCKYLHPDGIRYPYTRVGIKCSVCNRTVKGLSNFCTICEHGGHTKHIREWFKENNECPKACGCQCKIYNGGF